MNRRDSALEWWERHALANACEGVAGLSPRQLAALLEAERLARRARFLIDNGLVRNRITNAASSFPDSLATGRAGNAGPPFLLPPSSFAAPLLEYRLVALFGE